jgi:hypothetical protein
MQKLYAITYKIEVDLEDCIFTLSWEKAFELLNKYPNQKHIIEYTFDSNGVSECWNAFHFYDNNVLVSQKV